MCYGYYNAIYLVGEYLNGNKWYEFDNNTNSALEVDNIWSIPSLTGLYWDANTTANAFYKNSSFPSNLVLNITDYTTNDVTECIYPKYMIDYASWSYPLPIYNLPLTIILPVGSNIKNTINYIPFEQCQNSHFYFTVYKSTDSKAPDWTSVSQLNKTLIVDLSKVTSVLDSTILVLTARVLTCSLNGDYSQAQTQNYTTLFQFTNKNNDFLNSNWTYYIVMDEVSVFTFKFFDNENDQVILNANEIQNIVGFHPQRNSNDTNTISLLLQPKQISDDPVDIIVNYTDIYHQAVEFYTSINLQLYIFSVFPPVFDLNLTKVHGDMWSNFSYKLPSIADPQGLSYTVSLDSNTPQWVSLNNNSIMFDTTNSSYVIQKSSIITVIVTNEESAWTKYNLTVDVNQNLKPVFGRIDKVIATFGVVSQISVNVSSSTEIIAVNCTDNLSLSWINFSNNGSIICINATNLSQQNTWVKLVSYDTCGNKYESNSFSVNLQRMNPPTVTNTIGPLILFVGDEKLFLIPHDLFTSSSNLTNSLSVINCTTDHYLKSSIQNSTKFSNLYLYVFGDKTKSCQLSITATDPMTQKAQAIVEVTIK